MKLSTTLFTALSCWQLPAAANEQIVLQDSPESQIKPFNIAIIGAGAAGASSAYHLSKFSQDASIPLNITVFERNSYIGGRSTTVSAYNDSTLPVELGASIFVKVNKILVNAVKEFNLSTSSLHVSVDGEGKKIPGAALAVWDGGQIVLSQNGGWFDLAKLFWKYGMAPIKTSRLMKSTVGKFLKLYEPPFFPFEDLTKAAQGVELLAVTAATGEQYMRENGIMGAFGREVVQASTRVNYAMNLGFIHSLEAMVCMATDGAMAVEGGNWQIFEGMLKSSGARVLLDTEVGGVFPQDEERGYALNYSHTNGTGSGSGLFDAVILAAPYQFSELKSLGYIAEDRKPDKVPYVELHTTLLTSPHLLSPAFFNMPQDKAAPLVVLTTLPEGEPAEKGPAGVGSPGFYSISLLQRIINPNTAAYEYLYKIFSPQPVSPAFLARLLGVEDLPGNDADSISERDVTWIYRKAWNSYPYEYPRVTFENIKLGDNLWYTSGMDSFISTMETNALMGKNVARMMVDQLVEEGLGTMLEASILSETVSM